MLKTLPLQIVLRISLFSVLTWLAFPQSGKAGDVLSDPVIAGVVVNSCEGSITISVTSGTAPYSFAWENSSGNSVGANSFFINNLLADTYTVTVTDDVGKTVRATYTVTNPPDLVGTVEVNEVTCKDGEDAQVVITMANGNPAYEWELYIDGGGLVTDGTAIIPIINIGGLGVGDYRVEIADDDGCSGEVNFTILEPAEYLDYNSATVTDATCFNGSDGSISINVTGGWGNYSYEWISVADGSVVSSNQNATGLGPGNYYLRIIDADPSADECVITTTNYTVGSPAEIAPTATISGALCNGDANGSIDLSVTGGVGPYTYQWNDPANATTRDISGLAAGDYTVTITDANNCSKNETFTVSEPAVLALDPKITDVNCFGESTGRINSRPSGGTEPYTYTWSTGHTGKNLKNISAGTYSVTVTDANGCTATATNLVVAQPTAALSKDDEDIIPPSCFGGNDASIALTMAGGTAPYSYLWSNGETTATIGSLTAGLYSVTVTDANNCTYSSTFTVTDPPKIAVAPSLSSPSCYNGADGSITATASNGTAPYTYAWSTGDAGTTLSNITAGTYSVTVTDASGCQVTEEIILTQPGELTSNAIVNNISCSGVTDGSIGLAVTGGTPPFTYLWDDGSTTANRTGLGAGDYSVTITDAKGCSLGESFSVIDPDPITIDFDQTDLLCKGGTTGVIDVTPSGGTLPYTYLWSNGATSQDLVNVSAGSYSLTIKDAENCSATLSVTLTEPATVLELSGDKTNITCNGSNNGSIDLSVTGGEAPYTYDWSTGSNNQDVSGLAPGNYSVNVTDANGCVKSLGFTITQPAALSSVNTVNHVTCNGNDNGSITINPSGGTAPYTYAWADDGGLTSAARTDLTPANYTVTITDAQGCQLVQNITITEPTALSTTISKVDVSCFGESTGLINLTVNGGVAPYDFNWSNGASTEDISSLAAGDYTVIVTDANGCTTEKEITITQPSSALEIDGAAFQITCNGASDGIINVTVSGGVAPYSYNWSNGSTSEDLSALPAANYTLTVTDNNGCIASASYTITDPPVLELSGIVSDASCFDSDNGSIDITMTGGEAPYTYTWAHGPATDDLTDLAPGDYTLYVTDNRGCSTNKTFTIEEPDALSLSYTSTNVDCFGNDNGEIDITIVGGTAPYVYSWDNGSVNQDLSGLSVGTYEVTVTDIKGCTITKEFTIEGPDAALTDSGSATDISCFGGSDGYVTLAPAGGTAPYTYAWNNGATTKDIFGLTVGTYQVTITDFNGCALTKDFTINMPPALLASGADTDILCYGEATGAVDLTVSGGTLPYSFAWSNGATTEDISDVPAGSYSVTIQDASGCSLVRTFDVTEPLALNLGSTQADVSCFGEGNGFIQTNVSGGVVPYTYLWSNGATTDGIYNLSGGTYDLTLTDGNGCITTQSYTITEPSAALMASGVVIDEICFGDRQGAIDLSVSGGVAPYTTVWNQGATSEDIAGLRRGVYQVNVTDANGCAIQLNFAVGGPDELTLSADITDVSCNGAGDGTIDLMPNGGTGPYTYLWSGGETTQSLSDLGPGTYAVTATDVNGCTITESYQIQEPLAISVNSNSRDVSCFGSADGFVQVDVSGGIAPYTYSWSTGATTDGIYNLSGGDYTLTVTDANGCISIQNYSIVEPDAALAATAVITDEACFGDKQGAIDLTVTGGTAPYTMQWNQGATSEDIAGLGRGVYQVNIRDANGCTILANYTVAGPDEIVVTSITDDATCNGADDGSIALTTSGGTGPYTYAWSNGATTATVNGLAPGDYAVTITDANGCTESSSYQIQEPLAISVNSNSRDVSCFGSADGFVQVGVSGGIAPYTYSWSTGATTDGIYNLSGGDYTLTVTDANGCISIQNYSIVEPDAALAATAVITDEACFGDKQGAIDLTVTGGTAPYTMQWNQGATSEDIAGLGRGVYQVNIRDANGCTIQANYTVAGPDEIVVTSITDDVTCNGADDGSIALTTSGGTGPYTYAWSNGATTATVNGLAPGDYAVTITDANGCTESNSYQILEPLPLVVNYTSSDESCFGANDGTVNVTVSGGNLPYTYTWSTGATTEDLNNLSGGSYVLTVTDNKGCQITQTVIVDAVEDALTAAAVVSDANCAGQPGGQIQVTPMGGTGPYTYSWSNGSNQEDQVGLFAGEYELIMTDAQGCTFTATYHITEPEPLTLDFDIESTSCFGDDDGSIRPVVGGGVAPYSYIWSSGATSADLVNLGAGTYNLTVIDANGCSITKAAIIDDSQSLLLQVNKRDVYCKGDASGIIELEVTGGSGIYTYAWDNGANTGILSDLVAGVYSVTVSDAGGCQASASVVISEPAQALNATISGTEDISCFGDASGILEAQVSGGSAPYTYLWSNGERTSAIQALQAGDYTVSITDANDCLIQVNWTIRQPSEPISIAPSGKLNLDCYGDQDAFIEVAISGGSGDYDVLWSTGATGPRIENLAAGDYTIRVRDKKGCVEEQIFTVTEPEALRLGNAEIIESKCYNDRGASIELKVLGGTGPYTYLWDTGETTKNLIGLNFGTFNVSVTDANGCQVQASYTLAAPEIFDVAPAISPISCIGAGDASIALNIQGGVDPVIIQWSTGASTENISNLGPGAYSVLLTDKSGCTVQRTFNIVEPLALQLQASTENADECNNPASGAIEIITSGGTVPYKYQWSNGDTTARIENVLAGDYIVEVTDAFGCTIQGIYTVLQPDPLEIFLTTESYVDCANGVAGTIVTAAARGGVGDYTYNWSNGNTGVNEVLITEEGILTLELADERGCIQTSSVEIDVPSLGLADFIYDSEELDEAGRFAMMAPINFYDRSEGEIIDWKWDFGDGFNSSEINPVHVYDAAGIFTVTLITTDRQGCTSTKMSQIEIGEGYNVIFPNAFTPNGDGNNDFFRPETTGVTQIELIIFNTWGEIVFSSDDVEMKGWDGFVNSKKAENGNYVFKLSGTSFNGIKFKRDGVFALIK